ncbi:sulfite exporter TauE/SafE family protein [Kribbella sp. NPDC050124]|uniref:sulfite exporter TauE/SafE family protein n=1 Tax=Kribbella sp. NPDC050124 TaxID=3364114 RepID=UPI00378E586C
MDIEIVALLLVAAAVAGWFDAVVGGGGLVQLPVLMLALPSTPAVSLLATDKLSSISGTACAAVTFARRTKVDVRLALVSGIPAVALSGAGAAAAGTLPPEVLRPVVAAALMAVLVLVVARRDLGVAPTSVLPSRARVAAVVAVTGVALPFYNGFVGPGTGTMMVVALTTLLGTDFTRGSATSKLVNLGSNLGALLVFAWQGQMLWMLGLGMAAANMLGSRLGAGQALRRGSRFVRVVLIVVVSLLLARLAVAELIR